MQALKKSDLPKCNSSNCGGVYYVTGEAAFYYCDGKELRRLDVVGTPGAPGAPGAPGVTWLVSLGNATSAQCAGGGATIQVGPDANRNGLLEAGEVAGMAPVCNGKDGKDGQSGVDGKNGSDGRNGLNGDDGPKGLTSLIAQTVEGPGEHCTEGGVRIDSGVDADEDGVLDPAELNQTSYVCSAAAPVGGSGGGTTGGGGGGGAGGAGGAGGGSSQLSPGVDVFFLLDTTGDMTSPLTALKHTFVSTIVPQLRMLDPNVGFGLAEYKDITDPRAFLVQSRVVTGDQSSFVHDRLFNLVATGGGDLAEAGWSALYTTVAGIPDSSEYTVSPFPNPAYPGPLGAAGFRTDATKIVVWITNAPNHDDYPALPGRDQAVVAFQAIGARVLPILINPDADLSRQARDLAIATRGVVAPSAWGEPAFRPAGCAPSQCCTGRNGVGEPVLAQGNCSLSYSLDASAAGISMAIINGVQLLSASPQ